VGTKNKLGAKQQAPKAPGTRHRRRRGRGAKGAKIETPKASRGRGMGRGFPLPIRLGVWGSVVSSPVGSRAEPRRKMDLVHSDALRRPLVAKIHSFVA